MIKQLGEERVYLIVYKFISKGSKEGSQVNNPKAGTGAEAMKEHCLLVYSSRFTHETFFKNPRPPGQ